MPLGPVLPGFFATDGFSGFCHGVGQWGLSAVLLNGPICGNSLKTVCVAGFPKVLSCVCLNENRLGAGNGSWGGAVLGAGG